MSSWVEGSYSIYANMSTSEFNRTEILTYQNLTITNYALKYMCNGTTTDMIIMLDHPSEDYVKYNVSLQVPAGWTYAPDYVELDTITKTRYYANFTVNNSQAVGDETVNATVDYTHLGSKTVYEAINFSTSTGMPVLEVIPSWVA